MVCVVSWSQTIKAVSFHGLCCVISWSLPRQAFLPSCVSICQRSRAADFRTQFKEHRQSSFDDAKLRTIFEGRIAFKQPVSNILQLSLFFSDFLSARHKKAPETMIPVLTLTDKKPSLISYSISGRSSDYSPLRRACPSSPAHCTPVRHSAAAGSSARQPVA